MTQLSNPVALPWSRGARRTPDAFGRIAMTLSLAAVAAMFTMPWWAEPG